MAKTAESQNGGKMNRKNMIAPKSSIKTSFRILPDRNSTWPLLESSIWVRSCRPDTPSPRFGGPQAPAKDISPPRLSQPVPDRPVVLVHRQFPGACHRKCHPGRVSGPSGVVGKHVFNNADRISELQMRRSGCSQCVPVGRTGPRGNNK